MVRLNHDDMKQTKITMETIKDGNTKSKTNDKGNCCEPKTNISRMNMVVSLTKFQTITSIMNHRD
jgi:hypothetical protein